MHTGTHLHIHAPLASVPHTQARTCIEDVHAVAHVPPNAHPDELDDHLHQEVDGEDIVGVVASLVQAIGHLVPAGRRVRGFRVCIELLATFAIISSIN